MNPSPFLPDMVMGDPKPLGPVRHKKGTVFHIRTSVITSGRRHETKLSTLTEHNLTLGNDSTYERMT